MASKKDIFSMKGHKLDTSVPPDFCIKLKQESIPVRKEVLTSASHYFHCLFESGMQEVQNQTLILHELGVNHDISSHAVKTVVEYMYGDDLTIEWNDVADYLDIVESWQLSEIKDKLEDYIGRNIDPDNCITWLFIAQRYYMKKVKSKADEFIIENCTSVTASSIFLSLDLSTLKYLLADDIMMNMSSDSKLCVCINWILGNEVDRKVLYNDLLDHTGLLKCSQRFIQLVVRSYIKTLREDNGQSVKSYTSMLLAWTAEAENDKVETMVVLGDNPSKHLPNKNILQFDFDEETIKEIGLLPDAFVGSHPARCSTPYGMFSAGGGFNKYEGSVTCAFLDIPSLAYLRLPDLPIPMSDAGAVIINDTVYVLGGCRTPNFMYRINLQTLKWSRCANLPQRFYHPTVCTIGTIIYVFRAGILFELLTYSTVHDVWSSQKGFPIRYLMDTISGAIPVGSDIYVLTTSVQESRCVCYDTYLKQWTELAEFPARCDLCTAAYIDKKIVLGGSMPRIDIYNIQYNEWKESSLKMLQKMNNIFMMTVSTESNAADIEAVSYPKPV